jgi:hypothetical protein
VGKDRPQRRREAEAQRGSVRSVVRRRCEVWGEDGGEEYIWEIFTLEEGIFNGK